jgi:hypothetical protein
MTTRRTALPLLLLLLLGSLLALLFAAGPASAAGQFRCFYAPDGIPYRCSAPATEFPTMYGRAWTRGPAATITDGYPTYAEPSITAWRWSGAQWSQLTVDHSSLCYRPGSNCWRSPWAGAPSWSWYWEGRLGWVAVPTSQVELDIPASYVTWSRRVACFPGRGVPSDVSPEDARIATAYSCQWALNVA